MLLVERAGGAFMVFSFSSTPQEISIDPPGLPGLLGLPDNPAGLVLFAHGSGSSRHSPRNNHVAERLRAAGIATLLFDLLTPQEERDRANVFDIRLLASRLVEATDWASSHEPTRFLPLAYFGASTGGGAALVAAAARGPEIAAVVSRGGRPDLAGDALPQVVAPTLLIVGSRDEPVIALNRQAQARMRAVTELEIVLGASHLFEEPGTLDQVIELSRVWFVHHFARVKAGVAP